MSTLEEFIEEVRKNPCLYSKSEKHYYDQEKREDIWSELSERFDFDAKRKWLSFRERYAKEKKKLELSGPEGHKREIWPYFWNLQFLNDHIVSRREKHYSNKVSRLEDFIKDVRGYECLYNKKCVDYANAEQKEAIWQELSDKYNVDAKTKFQFLRERYCRERKKEEAKSSVGSTDPPVWVYFSLMEFLRDHICVRGPRKSVEKPHKECKVSQVYMTDEIPTMMFYKEEDPDDPLYKMDPEFEQIETTNSIEFQPEHKRMKLEDEYMLMNKINDIHTKLSHRTDEEMDEDWLFLKSMHVKMRKMSNLSKRRFKINMLIQADEATGEI